MTIRFLPQKKWARKQVKAGNCRICGERRNKYKQLCDYHQAQFTLYMREWRAAKKAAREMPNVPAPDSSPTTGSPQNVA